MSDLSPTSPLSISSDSNGCSDNVQNNVPNVDPTAQSPETPVLDGVRPHHTAYPSEPARVTFSDALKFGLESSGGSLNPIFEPKPSLQSRVNEHTRVLLIGDTFNPSHEIPSINHPYPT